MNKFESASILAGISPNEEAQALAPTNLHVITGEVVGQSENGKTLVAMDGMVFTGDDSQYVEIDTLGGLEEGDAATILLSGESGQAMTPLAIGSVGSVDRIAKSASDAYDIASSAQGIAQEAKEVAEATGQHVWPDDDGVHVTEVTQDEWNDSTGTSYHSGANVLLNALGQLFRDGLNNLLALVAGSTGHTYTFTIESGVYSYPLPFGESIAGDPTISIGGVTLPWSDCQLQFNYEDAGYSLLFSGDFDPATYAGQTATMTYNTSSSLSVFDGLGTAAQNIISFFDARGITLLGGRGVIQGNTSKQVGSAITEGGAVVGYNVMDVNVIRLANSSPDSDEAYAYLAIRANETYASDTAGEKIEGDVDYWRSGVQLVAEDDFGKVSVGLAAGSVGLQGNYLNLSSSDLSASESFPMQQAINELTESSGTGTYTSPFSAYGGSNGNLPRWWRSGNVVHFSGIATVTSQQADATRTLFTLPAGFRPNGRNRYLGRMQGSGMNSWELSVETSGEVKLQRYGTTSAIALTSGVWLPYAGTFII